MASAGEIAIPRAGGAQRKPGQGQKMEGGANEDPLRRTMANYEDLPRSSQERGPIYDSGEGPLPNAKKGGPRNNAVYSSGQSFGLGKGGPNAGARRNVQKIGENFLEGGEDTPYKNYDISSQEEGEIDPTLW